MKNTRQFQMVLAGILVASCGLFAVPEVSIHYIGHSSFILQFDNGISVLTDYGTSNCWNLASPIYDIGEFVPTILTYSHRHADHYNEDRKPEGALYQLENTDSLIIDGLSIRPIRVCEGVVGVESSTAFVFTYKGFKICHLSDAQADIMAINDKFHQNDMRALFPDQFDLLLMTIEGVEQFITEAEIFVNLLKPKRIIPMHYWTEVYKTRFINHLQAQNSVTGRNYQIQDENSADSYLSSENFEVTPVLVVNLAPAAYVVSDMDGSGELMMPIDTDLIRNYPNPFNPTTNIQYTLHEQNDVKVSVFNGIGELVETLINGQQDAGEYSIRWNAGNYPSGIYLYRIQAGNFSRVKRCMLIK
ncbi:MAG: MBL fold metallo-hydrolase [Candidatus Marinimicrobia bacterium]|nr:MBL fold metallo-hydrolase [Candidatus Neomarinimicrobiota bacterium]